jgi:hypothetical protein
LEIFLVAPMPLYFIYCIKINELCTSSLLYRFFCTCTCVTGSYLWWNCLCMLVCGVVVIFLRKLNECVGLISVLIYMLFTISDCNCYIFGGWGWGLGRLVCWNVFFEVNERRIILDNVQRVQAEPIRQFVNYWLISHVAVRGVFFCYFTVTVNKLGLNVCVFSLLQENFSSFYFICIFGCW